VGVGTVISDNPRLNVRLADGPDPLPVILDTRLRTPPNCRLAADGARPLILCGSGAPAAAEARLRGTGARVIRLQEDAEGRVDLRPALAALLKEGIGTLMVEGGTAVLGAFLSSGLWDRAAVTLAPLWLGGCGIPIAFPARLEQVRWVPAGDDVLCLGWRAP
jgi:riboflavin-specific deaminase-like protein